MATLDRCGAPIPKCCMNTWFAHQNQKEPKIVLANVPTEGKSACRLRNIWKASCLGCPQVVLGTEWEGVAFMYRISSSSRLPIWLNPVGSEMKTDITFTILYVLNTVHGYNVWNYFFQIHYFSLKLRPKCVCHPKNVKDNVLVYSLVPG